MSDDFSVDGTLARAIPGFNPRESQQKMALAIQQCIPSQRSLVIEAGTGTGKTYAYLVPALRADKKVIISTGSKTLQDQLYHRDLPALIQALNWQGQAAILKGRANYLCIERAEAVIRAGGDRPLEQLNELVKLQRWSTQTDLGDISQCAEVAEDSLIWPEVTSTNENCLGGDCPHYSDCYVVKARKRAMDADLVVVNHHLFLADCVVKKTGFAELIPSAGIVIFDEAHQLPDIASQYFGEQLSSRQLQDLARDITMVYRTEVGDLAQLQKVADRLHQVTQDFRQQLGEPGFRGNLSVLLHQSANQQMLRLLDDALTLCLDVLKLAVGRSALLDAALERATGYRNKLNRLLQVDETGYSYWFELTRHHFILALTPLSVASQFIAIRQQHPACWVFTSATLSVQGSTQHFTTRLGLANAQQLLLPSPFNYQQQSLLCVPRNLPEPFQGRSAEKLVALLAPVINANSGRCFLLCTSWQMMRQLSELFRAQLALPVFTQGETSKAQLLNQFVTAGNALLVATNSFWEGVDIPGRVLSLVIIDKLPFTSPEDPLLKARMEDAQRRGLDPFATVQLPEAVIMLKQGVGRLIRNEQDSGALIICDDRLVSRPYGEVFLQSLPDCPRTRSLDTVRQFLQETDTRSTNSPHLSLSPPL